MINIREVKLSEEAKYYDKLYKKQLQGDQAILTAENEEETALQPQKNVESEVQKGGKDWKGWLGEGTFYIHGIVYMLVRIAVNVTMTVQPFYVVNVTGFLTSPDNPSPYQLALVPLLSYITSLIFSLFIQQRMTRALKNRFLPMLVAIGIIILTSVPLIFLTENPSTRWLIYPLAAIQGVGLAIMLNTATSLISDVIGNDSESSAFVYGCYSLFDKFANGGLLYYVSA